MRAYHKNVRKSSITSPSTRVVQDICHERPVSPPRSYTWMTPNYVQPVSYCSLPNQITPAPSSTIPPTSYSSTVASSTLTQCKSNVEISTDRSFVGMHDPFARIPRPICPSDFFTPIQGPYFHSEPFCDPETNDQAIQVSLRPKINLDRMPVVKTISSPKILKTEHSVQASESFLCLECTIERKQTPDPKQRSVSVQKTKTTDISVQVSEPYNDTFISSLCKKSKTVCTLCKTSLSCESIIQPSLHFSHQSLQTKLPANTLSFVPDQSEIFSNEQLAESTQKSNNQSNTAESSASRSTSTPVHQTAHMRSHAKSDNKVTPQDSSGPLSSETTTDSTNSSTSKTRSYLVKPRVCHEAHMRSHAKFDNKINPEDYSCDRIVEPEQQPPDPPHEPPLEPSPQPSPEPSPEPTPEPPEVPLSRPTQTSLIVKRWLKWNRCILYLWVVLALLLVGSIYILIKYFLK